MIYISTGGVSNKPAWRTVEELLGVDITRIELSGGHFDIENVPRLKKLTSLADFKVHNFFPPPSKPFVLNLASIDKKIRELSLEHVKRGIETAVELDCAEYSFHAGFLLDPRIDELGGSLGNRGLSDRVEALNIFLECVNAASEYARKQGVELLIENNVLSADVYAKFQVNPFLMVTAGECVSIMDNTPSNTNLLLDMAHLNVSADTLRFDRKQFLQDCNKWIGAYHLSDNDGTSDSNDKVTEDSWFWEYMKPDFKFCSLEIYNVTYTELTEQLHLVRSKLGGNHASA